MSQEKLLVVTDDLSMRILCRDTLESAGYQLFEAENYEQAVARMDSALDLVLIDLVPGNHNTGIVDFIHQHQPDCPVILLSTDENRPMVIDTLNKGASDFLQIPLLANELHRVVQHWLSYRRLKLENALLQNKNVLLEATKDSDEKYQSLMQSAGDAVFIADAETGILLDANRSAEKLIGRQQKEIIGLHQSKLHPQDELEKYTKLFKEHVASGGGIVPKLVYVQHSDGRRIPVEINSVVAKFGHRQVILGVFRDISEHKRVQQELLESELKFRQLAENINEVFWVGTPDWNEVLYVSPAYEQIWGRSCQSLLDNPRSWLEAVAKEDFGKVDDYIKRKTYSEQPEVAFPEYRILRPDDSVRWIRARAFPVRNEAGDIYRIAGIAEDITARKQTELLLRENEKKFKAILDVSPVPLAMNDDLGNITYLNKNFVQVTGYTREDIPTLADWWPRAYPDPVYRQQIIDQWQTHILQSQSSNTEFIPIEAIVHCKDGSTRIFMASAALLQEKFAGNHLAVLYDITERKQAETALVESHKLLQTIIDTAPVRIFWKDRQSRLLGCNPAFAHDAGAVSPEDIIGKTDFELGWKEQAEPYRADDSKVMDSGIAKLAYDEPQTTPDGKRIWLSTSKVPLNNTRNETIGVLGIYQDITDRKNAELELQIAATAFDANVGILVTDAKGVIVRANRTFCEQSGYSNEEAIGQTARLLKSDRHDEAFYAEMWESLNRTGAWEGEIWDRRKDGEIYPKWLSIKAIVGKNGIVNFYVGTQTDITERKNSENVIRNLAFYDPLTSLPNRRLLHERLLHAFATCKRNGQAGALFFLDLDHFKTINDTLGHLMGDKLLEEVGKRLTNCVREQDMVARLGGDEFVVMLENLDRNEMKAAKQSEVIAEKILAELNRPYQLGSQLYHNTSSMGITLFTDDSIEIDELFKQADIAMYQAKKAGRNTLRFFDPQMQETITSRVELERELRIALERQQFQLYYQPQVDELNLSLGAEALLRWNHPERGLVPPNLFIPLAEEIGLILPIGQWVLETACAQLQTWQQHELTRELTLAVNVSVRQFRQHDFAANVQAVVQQYGIKPNKLKLELTESMLLENTEKVVATMNALKAIGVHLSLDDFGTGYSSLQYLKQLPLNQLKIDQSFVRDLSVDKSDMAIVTTIIAMAHGLNLEVIAEGVETKEQQEYLASVGCRHYQGYLFGKPVPIDQFEEILRYDKVKKYFEFPQ